LTYLTLSRSCLLSGKRRGTILWNKSLSASAATAVVSHPAKPENATSSKKMLSTKQNKLGKLSIPGLEK